MIGWDFETGLDTVLRCLYCVYMTVGLGPWATVSGH